MTKAQNTSLAAQCCDQVAGAAASEAPLPGWVARAGLVLGALAMIVIAVACLMPVEGPQAPGSGIDKLYHFVAYLGLVLPLIASDPRRWVWVVPGAILFGGAIELIQPRFGRTAELLDFGANVTGVLTGWVLADLLHPRLTARFARCAPGPAGEQGAGERGAAVPPEDGAADEAAALAAVARARREALMAELRAALDEELDGAARPIRRPRPPAPIPPAAIPPALGDSRPMPALRLS